MKFNEDNQFWQYATLVTDFILLNLSFIVACLPIVTIGSAISALFATTLDLSEDESRYLVQPFWKEFQRHFLRKTCLFLIDSLLIAALCYVIEFWYHVQGFAGIFLAVFFSFVLVIVAVASLIGLALSTRYESSIGRLMKNSFLLLVVSPLQGLLLLASLIIFVALVIYQPYFLIALFFVGFALLAYIMAFMFKDLFKKVH